MENGYVIPIINENIEEIPMVGKLEEKEIKMALKEKFEGERALSSSQKPTKKSAPVQNRAYVNGKWIDLPSGGLQKEWLQENALIRINSQGYMEVDLHAESLLDTTIGMDNTAILKYQLEKFNEAMAAVLHKRGSKIVFIHGKGDGVLRNALIKELKTKYSQSKWQDASFKEYGYGATLVTV
ncbi:MAG: Smr/MutS family protein [Bacteroidales bacterium]|nr:Smr/MutS family protein [Bacteroidales bacterium]